MAALPRPRPWQCGPLAPGRFDTMNLTICSHRRRAAFVLALCCWAVLLQLGEVPAAAAADVGRFNRRTVALDRVSLLVREERLKCRRTLFSLLAGWSAAAAPAAADKTAVTVKRTQTAADDYSNDGLQNITTASGFADVSVINATAATTVTTAATATAAAPPDTVAIGDDSTYPCDGGTSIASVLMMDPERNASSIFQRALVRAGLTARINDGSQRSTLFVPTDEVIVAMNYEDFKETFLCASNCPRFAKSHTVVAYSTVGTYRYVR